MKLRPEEITSVLKSRIKSYEAGVEIQEVGTVVQVGDGVARIQGLENAVASEMLELPHGVMGLVLNLEEDSVGAVLMGEDTLIKEGDQVKRTGKVIQVPVGEALVGRVVNPLGLEGHAQKLSDFMVNSGMPRRGRAGWPLGRRPRPRR